MSTEHTISIELYCRHEGVDHAFVMALHERGIVQLVLQADGYGIPPDELPRLERLLRMHHDLDINLEGLEAISHLLDRMERLQQEVRGLNERLRLYEGG